MNTECIEKSGSSNPKGYIRISRNGRALYAHRAAWEDAYGPIPPGLCVLHKCDNPRCARPDHLFLGTRAENNLDMTSKGRHWQQQKTHCIRGHALATENCRPYFLKLGRRQCIICHREGAKLAKQKKKVARTNFRIVHET